MEHPGFFDRAGPFRLDAVAVAVDAELPPGVNPAQMLSGVAPLADARVEDVTFIDNKKYLGQLSSTAAGACLVHPAFAARLPLATTALLTKAPYRSFALALALFYPDAMRPKVMGARAQTLIDATARIEDGASIEPGAMIGPEACIGRGTVIAAGAVVGYRCMVGRDCFVGPGASLTHALVGDRVVIHAGTRIGQDGFGFAMGAGGHLKVPQIGRVIIQDDVEIGANSAIDRGALKDTIIGEGTKIDNLVQIGHNVVIGRHCVIVGQCGIAGSAELGDFVVMGGHAGVAGHIKIGAGAQIAGSSHVIKDLAPGMRVVGTPSQSLRQWTKERLALRRLAEPTGGGGVGDDEGDSG